MSSSTNGSPTNGSPNTNPTILINQHQPVEIQPVLIPREYLQYSTSYRLKIEKAKMEYRFVQGLLVDYMDAIVETQEDIIIINFKFEHEASKFRQQNKDFLPLGQTNTIQLENVKTSIGQDVVYENMKTFGKIIKVEKLVNADYAIVELENQATVWKTLEFFGRNTIYLFGENVLPTTASIFKTPEIMWTTDAKVDWKPVSIDESDYLLKECATNQVQKQKSFILNQKMASISARKKFVDEIEEIKDKYEFLIFKANFCIQIDSKIQEIPSENRAKRQWWLDLKSSIESGSNGSQVSDSQPKKKRNQ